MAIDGLLVPGIWSKDRAYINRVLSTVVGPSRFEHFAPMLTFFRKRDHYATKSMPRPIQLFARSSIAP